jgi:hypothetical protein
MKLKLTLSVNNISFRWGWVKIRRYRKEKVKVILEQGHEGPEVKYRNIYTLSLTSALDEVGGQCHVEVALPP